GTDGLAWAAPLPGGCKRHHDVEGGDERRQITRESVAEERGDPRHTGLGCRHDLLGRIESTRSHHSSDHQPKLRSKTDPDPLSPVLAFGQAFARLVCLTRVLTRDKVPHLVELHLGHRQILQQMMVDCFGLMAYTLEPCQ